MPLKIFVCYRRDDTEATAGRLRDYLSGKLGSSAEFFMDVDDMNLGTNYLAEIRREVASCDVLLAVMGSEWSAATDKLGRRRLDLETDSVRVEISTAIESEIPIIPVLVDGATIPQENELPADLAALVFQAGVALRNSSFRNDASRLVGHLERMANAKADAAIPSSTIERRDVGAGEQDYFQRLFGLIGHALNSVRTTTLLAFIAILPLLIGLIVGVDRYMNGKPFFPNPFASTESSDIPAVPEPRATTPGQISRDKASTVCYRQLRDGSRMVCFRQSDGTYDDCKEYTGSASPHPVCG